MAKIGMMWRWLAACALLMAPALHTPGGDPNAVESIVEYLHAKFSRIEVIVPYLAMSGGATIDFLASSCAHETPLSASLTLRLSC